LTTRLMCVRVKRQMGGEKETRRGRERGERTNEHVSEHTT